MAADSKRIPTLDGWRAVAILMVIACHCFNGYGQHLQMGVDVFFAISGLLITARLLDDCDLRQFYIRRAFRILPPVLCYLGFLGFAGLLVSRWEALASLSFWRNYYMAGSSTGFTGHFWSLSLEEQFYLVWPFALCWLGKSRAPKILFWAIIAQNGWRMFVLTRGSSVVMTRGDLRTDGLAWGALAAFALYCLPSFRLPQWIVIPCFGTGFALYHFFPAMTVIPLALAVSVLGTVQNPGSLVSCMLESPVLIWIGNRSYGLYIWQQLFIFYGELHVPFWLSISVRLIALVVFAEISYVLLERPLQNLGRRLAGRKRELVMSAAIA